MLANTLQNPSPLTDEQESARLAAVRRYQLLDTPPDGAFDRITEIAAGLFDVPIAIISLVDTDRIWFKSHHGLDVEQIGRDPGLCASAVLQDGPWLVNDARIDPRTLANPVVAGEMGLRFYLGVPLRTSDGHNLGTLCVIDREPREVDEKKVKQLENLAAVVMDQMELRLAARQTIGDLSENLTGKQGELEHAGLMAREIDHRVKNSLQLVSSLLMLQSRSLADKDAAAQLARAANRVGAVARVHQHIYSSETKGVTDCMQYLRDLTEDLTRALGIEDRGIEIECLEPHIPTKRIVPIGLIINELITNAAKHGAGAIRVHFGRADDGMLELAVADDGDGLPEDFDPAGNGGLGTRVVSGLVQQLDGEVSYGRDPQNGGTRVLVRFADADLPRPN